MNELPFKRFLVVLLVKISLQNANRAPAPILYCLKSCSRNKRFYHTCFSLVQKWLTRWLSNARSFSYKPSALVTKLWEWYTSKLITRDTGSVGWTFLFVKWWRYEMKTFFALLAVCAGKSPVTGEFPAHRPVKRSFDGFLDLRLNKRLNKQSRHWWIETDERLAHELPVMHGQQHRS